MFVNKEIRRLERDRKEMYRNASLEQSRFEELYIYIGEEKRQNIRWDFGVVLKAK